MAVAVGEIYQLTVQMLLRGQVLENVIHLRARTAILTDANAKLGAQEFWTLYRKPIADSVTLTQLIVKQMTPVAFDQQFTTAATGESAGARGGAATATTLAGVWTLRTGVAGKTHRGRIYVPGMSTGDLVESGDRINPSVQGTIQGFADDLLDDFGDATGTNSHFALGIYSRLIGGTNPFTLAGWQAVTQIVVQPILGNQRRRRQGVGV